MNYTENVSMTRIHQEMLEYHNSERRILEGTELEIGIAMTKA